jgi:branched-chain amino acid transport system substrate-binding protein
MRKRVGIMSVAIVTALAMLTFGGNANAAAPTAASKEPIRIALMGIFSGQFATPGADNPFKLAVNKINSSGGILGRKIEYKEFDTDITPQGASTATSLAMQYNPDVVIGYGVSAGLKASAAQLNGVLVIHNTLDKLTTPDSLGSDLTFRLQPTVAQFAGAADRFLFKDQGVKALMVMNTQDAAPTDGANLILAEAQDSSVKTDHRAFSPTVTDLTEPILAAKSMNADAIWEWGYPTTDGLTIKTAGQNGFKGGIMTFSAGAAAKAGLIPASLLTDQVYSVTANCAPSVLDTPAAKAYVTAYTAKYGSAPTTSVANENYDAVYLYKMAAEQAKSIDSPKVAKALAKVQNEGVCGTEKADANHNLEHSVTIVTFPNGKEALAKLENNVASPY